MATMMPSGAALGQNGGLIAVADGVAARPLVAPDKFKGTFSAREVAEAIAAGLGGDCDLCPIADGGEGTAAILLEALGGEWRSAPAHDAIGRPIEARFVFMDDGATAVCEVAEASGLWRLADDERDPLGAGDGLGFAAGPSDPAGKPVGAVGIALAAHDARHGAAAGAAPRRSRGSSSRGRRRTA
jgi:glycerate kinase